MRYMLLDRREQEELLAELASMPDLLQERFGGLQGERAARRPGDDRFAPVEHCWHLADLEVEGFGERIRRLAEELEPELPDFEGGRLAEERRYRTRSLADGIAAFRAARRENLRRLRSLNPEQWLRRGTQDGVGPVSLCDLPAMMAEHDAAHREEIDAWRAT
jgi:DinB superfamily